VIVCSRCSKDNQDHYKFCLGCGAELPRESSKPRSFSVPTPPGGVPTPGRTTDAPQAPQTQGGRAEALASAPQLELDPTPMQPARSKPVAVQDPLPPELAPLGEETSPCPHCGAQVPENFRFCHVCGDDLHAEASGAPLGDAPAERVSAPAVSGAPQPAAACARLALIQPDGSEGESFPLPAEGSLIGRATGGIFANDAYLSPELRGRPARRQRYGEPQRGLHSD